MINEIYKCTRINRTLAIFSKFLTLFLRIAQYTVNHNIQFDRNYVL